MSKYTIYFMRGNKYEVEATSETGAFTILHKAYPETYTWDILKVVNDIELSEATFGTLEDSEGFYDKQTANEMNAISAMLTRSSQEGLQCEVVYTFSYEVKTKSIEKACTQALYEWEI